MFDTLLDAIREYLIIGEAFLFVEEDEVHPTPVEENSKSVRLAYRLRPFLPSWLKRRLDEKLFTDSRPSYKGPDRIMLIPPEQVELEFTGTDGKHCVFYRPNALKLEEYLADPFTPTDIKETLREEERVELNTDPFKGSYAIHFASKKSSYELHGRSLLQRCMRTIIYREKLRQVQNELAASLTDAGVNEKLASLNDEWTNINRELAIGLGVDGLLFNEKHSIVPSLLRWQGNNAMRESLARIIETQVFLPIAMKKGFYELHNGVPYYLYPRISF